MVLERVPLQCAREFFFVGGLIFPGCCPLAGHIKPLPYATQINQILAFSTRSLSFKRRKGGFHVKRTVQWSGN